MPGLTLITAAADMAVSLAEAKAHCGIEVDDFDTLLTGYIDGATAAAEAFTGQAIRPQTWQLALDDFADAIELPRGPVTEVSEVTYLDEDGASQTLATSSYVIDLVSNPARVVRDSDATWPDVDDVVNAVTIEFVAGYGTVPGDIKQALLQAVAAWFADRATAGALPKGAQDLLWRYRRLIF